MLISFAIALVVVDGIIKFLVVFNLSTLFFELSFFQHLDFLGFDPGELLLARRNLFFSFNVDFFCLFNWLAIDLSIISDIGIDIFLGEDFASVASLFSNDNLSRDL